MQKWHQGINFNVYTAKKTVFVCFAIFKYQLQFCLSSVISGECVEDFRQYHVFVFPPPLFVFFSCFFFLFFLIKMTACNWEAGDRSPVFISQIRKYRLFGRITSLPVRRLRGHCKLPASQFKEEIVCPWASSRIFIWLSCLLDESCTLNCLCLSPVFTRKRYIRPVCLLSTCSWMSYYHVTLI